MSLTRFNERNLRPSKAFRNIVVNGRPGPRPRPAVEVPAANPRLALREVGKGIGDDA